MKMSDFFAGQSKNMLVVVAISVLLSTLLHFFFKIIFKTAKKSHGLNQQGGPLEGNGGAAVAEESTAAEQRPSGKSRKRGAWKTKTEFSHPWLLKTLKGHPGRVLAADLAPNGKYLAAACDDGSVILWDIRDFSQKEHRTLRVNLEFDHATHVAWSPDSKAFLLHTARDNRILVYKIEKKKDGGIATATRVLAFEKVHKEDAVGFGISSNGKFIMSCSAGTDLVVWDLRGQQLARLDTYLMTTFVAKVSPCGRFVVAAGFAPDVKVLEVAFTKSGEFKQVAKAFELTGHTAGVYDVAFDADTSHIATLSKDGTWKLYHTNIEYSRGECPREVSGAAFATCSAAPRAALSPAADVLAVTAASTLLLYDTHTAALYDAVEDIFAGPITDVKFDSSGKYLFVCGERAVRVVHNVCGYAATVARCERTLPTVRATATRDRLLATIKECRDMLAQFGKN